MTNADAKVAKSSNGMFECIVCDYFTCRRTNFRKHLTTLKHRRLTNADKKEQKVAQYCCPCGKSYTHRQSLHKHSKSCSFIDNLKSSSCSFDNLTKYELLTMIHEQNQIIKDIIPQIGNTTNNIRNNNVNIQLFLDEKCKDAMTLKSFAREFQMTIEDVLKYTQGKQIGVSNILIQNLRPIPIIQRPMHCTNVQKHTWMIKDDEGWKRDNGNSVIKVAEYEVNKRFHDLWEVSYPYWKNKEHLTDTYLAIVRCITSKSTDKDIEKILRKIGSEYQLTSSDIGKN